MRDVKKSHSPNIDLEKLIEGHGPVQSDQLIAIGDNVGGCEVVALLAKGGNGEVYLGIDHSLGRRLAIKVLARGDEISKARFAIEVKLLSGNEHSWLPRYYGSGVHEGHEYVKIEELVPVELPAKDSAVAKYVVKVAELVGGLHKMGYIHRDIKPDNVMKRLDGELVLIDLGLVTPIGGTSPMQPRMSIVGDVQQCVGTPGFSGPEQFSGGEATVKSDIHALGALANACFSGNPPPTWGPIIDRAMNSLPTRRFSSVEEFVWAVKKRRSRRKKVPFFDYLKIVATVVSIVAGSVTLYMAWANSRNEGVVNEGVSKKWPGGLAPADVRAASVKHGKFESDANLSSAKVKDDGLCQIHTKINSNSDWTQKLQRAAEGGNAQAQRELGDIYAPSQYRDAFKLIAMPEDPIMATNWWFQSASNGDDSARYRLGMMLWTGCGSVDIDREAARCWLSQAATNKNAMAQYKLGMLLMEEDPVTAAYWLKKQAEEGNGKTRVLAKRYYSRLVLEGVVAGDKLEARSYESDAAKELKAFSEKGDADAMCELAGLEPDKDKALRLYKEAAEAGCAEAQFIVGWMYSNSGNKELADKSAEWYWKAISNGCNLAYANLGYLYDHGTGGVEKDEHQGFLLYEEGARKGDACAQSGTALHYLRGFGTTRNDEEAFRWFKRASQQCYAEAHLGLALCYGAGLGVKRDIKQSAKYFRLAVERGVKDNENIKMAGRMLLEAASNGDAESNFIMGVCEYIGMKVEIDGRVELVKDENSAIKRFEMAAERGIVEAKEFLLEAKKRLAAHLGNNGE